MRLPQDGALAPDRRQHVSPTPIYDALCVEYRKSFRALPGDRMGEEDLGFVAFSALGRLDHRDRHDQTDQHTQPGQHRGFMNTGQGHAGGRGDREPGGGRHRVHLPALPPAPRDGRGRGV